jgi:hypothetical protein
MVCKGPLQQAYFAPVLRQQLRLSLWQEETIEYQASMSPVLPKSRLRQAIGRSHFAPAGVSRAQDAWENNQNIILSVYMGDSLELSNTQPAAGCS